MSLKNINDLTGRQYEMTGIEKDKRETTGQ